MNSTRLGFLPILLALTVASPLVAGGGPHNVLVVANARSEDSVFVANHYRAVRQVPERNVCRLDIPLEAFAVQDALTPEQFDEHVVGPLKRFLAGHPAADRLHFIVLCPDIPLRVEFPKPVGPRSLASMLTLLGAEAAPKRALSKYFRRVHAFEAVPFEVADPIGRQRLVTVLRGYERADALALADRSVAADGTAPKGTFHFVLSSHVRGYEETVTGLSSRGLAAELHQSGKPVSGAKDVMAYFSGGTYSGLQQGHVFSNTYRPGAVVDMLESFGATWPTWRGYGYHRQVPVAWFIRAGASGVHGTTGEPYANVFPSSGNGQVFFGLYLGGCNLAEAYWATILELQWQNVVFGDPLCAPYARRGRVEIEVGPPKADSTEREVLARVTQPEGSAAPREVRLFADGRFVGAAGDLDIGDGGVFRAAFKLDTADLAPGWHRLRAVSVDASPAAVQSWAVADVDVQAKGRALDLSLAADAAKAASGDALTLKAAYQGQPEAKTVELVAGDRRLATFAAGSAALDTSLLGPGQHELQARALGADDKRLALSGFLTLELAEPLHVVRMLPNGATGTQPLILLRYNEELPFAQAALSGAVRLTQGGRAVTVRCVADGRNLIVEPRAALKAGAECKLVVAFPQAERRSRDVSATLTPTADAKLLYTLPPDACTRMTVAGLTGGDGNLIAPIWRRPARVVLGPVDPFTPERPALWSLPACGVSATLTILPSARPEKQDDLGAGLGVMYSDIDNHCHARIERSQVVVYQTLGGKTTRLAAWPAPGETTGKIPMAVAASGPRVTVTVGGKTLGTVMVDRTLPPGLPWLELASPISVSAKDVRVFRP